MIQKQHLIGEPLQLKEETVSPPRVRSYLFWRDVFANKYPEYKWLVTAMKQNGWNWGDPLVKYTHAHENLYGYDCGFCQGRKTILEDWGYYYCLCYLLEKQMEWHGSVIRWGSNWTKNSLDELDLNIPNTPEAKNAQRQLREAVAAADKWMAYPLRWMALSGPTGTGKTHILNSMMELWKPMGIYVVASEFDDRLREYYGGNQSDIQRYINALKSHPLLFFDDFGTEYASPWIAQKLENLFECRSRMRHWHDTITVLTTNLRKQDMIQKYKRDGVSRIGSRVTDNEIIDWYALSGRDYRHKKR